MAERAEDQVVPPGAPGDGGLGRRWGLPSAGAALAATTAALLPARGHTSLTSVALLYLLPVVATAAVGNVWLALTAAAAAAGLVNFFFVPPYHTLRIESRDNLIALAVYVVVACAVAVAVDVAARHRAIAARTSREATLLAGAAQAPPAAASLTRLLTQVRDGFQMTTVAFVEDDVVVDQVGPAQDDPPSLTVPSTGGASLVAWGPPVFAEDRSTLTRLAAAAVRTRETQRLADEAARAGQLAETDRLRAALLSAVGHDLRTPLASIKAAVSSLRQPEIVWSAGDEAQLLATVEESTDRLVALVENLLSLSRLQAGALSVNPRPVSPDGVVAQALLSGQGGWSTVEVDVPDDLPLVVADPGLLERVVANLIANACTASPRDRGILVRGHIVGQRLLLEIIDHGPGIPQAERERVFAPFQRHGDRGSDGLGLGLAIAKGFTEAMGGSITPTETPGGGLTMTIDLPVAP